MGSSSLTRDRTQVSCIGAQSLSHWPTEEFPQWLRKAASGLDYHLELLGPGGLCSGLQHELFGAAW